MMGFWLLAALLLLLVVGLLLAPIIRTPSERPRYLAVLATGAGLPAFVIALYLAIGNWQLTGPVAVRPASTSAASTAAADGAGSVEAMVGQLAGRLQSEGGSKEDWQMLGRSYMVMGRFQEAADAFALAREQDPVGDPELRGQYAEARVLSDPGELQREAGELFEQVLAERPLEPRALWYGGMAAMQRGDTDLAVQRWQALLNQSPPDELRQVLVERIAQAGGTVASEAGASSSASVAVPAAQKNALALSVAAPAELLRGIDPQTPVFVLARGEQPGPPLAAKRMRVADLPFEITLSDDDAMLAGRNISSLKVAEVVARIALGGSPEARPGDLFGRAEPQAGQGPLVISINQRVE